MKRTRYILSAITLLLFMTNAGFSVFSQESDTLRIATYNIRIVTSSDTGNRAWANRKQYVGNIINTNKFDIFGLQEIANATQQNELMAYLPDYSIYWKGRSNTAGTTGERCAIVYRTSRFQLLQSDWFFLSETPDTYSIGWDAQLARICMWAKMKDKFTNQEFYFVNTHFDHVGSTARSESAKLVMAKIKEITENDDLPVFFVGDLNFSTENGTIAYVAILDGGFRDGRNVPPRRQVTGPVGTSNGWNMAPSEYTESKRIDYIFVNNQIDVFSYRTIDTKFVDNAYPSDHFPVMITAKIKVDISGSKTVHAGSQVKVYATDKKLHFVYEYPFDFEVYNSIGVLNAKRQQVTNSVTVPELASGVYFIKTISNLGKTVTKVIIN